MFRQVLFIFVGMISLLYVSLFREFSSLPALKTTLRHLIDIPYAFSLFLFVFILFPLPLCTVVFCLSHLKKYVFNHIKNISKCFNRAIYLLLISYAFLTILCCTFFLFDLAFKEYYYFIVRMSHFFPNSHYPHMFTVNLLTSLVVQSSVFSVAFLITEIVLTFKFKVTSIKFSQFLYKNIPSITFTLVAFIFNISFLIWLESKYFQFSADYYYRTFNIVDKIIESAFANILAMYLYTILAIYEN